MNGLREREKKNRISAFTCGRIDNKAVLICNNGLGGWIISVVSIIHDFTLVKWQFNEES